jgi:hypothetical protein
MSMLNIFKSSWTQIIATIALLQPWILALFKRCFRRGKIEIYKGSRRVEIGYNTLGPTIWLNGTLRCMHRDFFIHNIELKLSKLKDSSTHRFGWGVFRTKKLTYSGEPQSTLELPFGFVLSPLSPRHFNIMFQDMQLQYEMRQILMKLYQEWSDFQKPTRFLHPQK